MTDQTIPADLTREEAQAVREWAERALTAWSPDKPVAKAARVVLASLPSPQRPTLADMTDKERAACKWMQADVEGVSGRYVIIHPSRGAGVAETISEDGKIRWFAPGQVTPRPDLPRMEWPGSTPVAPDHLAVGTVIESADDPRIDALPVGSVLLDLDEEATIKGRGDWTGAGYIPIPSEGAELGPWTVLHIPKEEA